MDHGCCGRAGGCCGSCRYRLQPNLPVIEDGELKGIVSIGDLVKHRLDAKELEASVLLDLSRMRA